MSNGNELDRSDFALVQGAAQGNTDDFCCLYTRYERAIYSFTYRMMGDADDAFDMTQTTFVKAYMGAANFKDREGGNVSAWLHRIATNACLDVLRRRQRLRWLPWEPVKHEPMLVAGLTDDPERQALKKEASAIVQHVLEEMTHRHRAALVLREYQGLSCEEIGAVMNLSRSAVKSMLFRARDEFRGVYASLYPGQSAQERI